MIENKRVLVIGANGMLGHSLVPYLLNKGYFVGSCGTSNNSEYIADMSIQMDAFAIFDKFNPDVVVNLAAYTDVDGCEKHPDIAYKVNALIVKNISDWIKKTLSKCLLVQLSTDHFYNDAGNNNENNIIILNHYASSKLAGELFASTVKSTVLRTNFFGISKHSERFSISDWIISSLKKGKSIRVFKDVFFSPITIDRLLIIIEMVIVKEVVGLYNVGSKNGMSKSDFAITIANEFRMSKDLLIPCKINELNLFAKRPHDMRMDCSKFEINYNYKFPSLLDEIKLLKMKYE